MRQIISIQIGECGNKIGKQFWESICKQHAISPEYLYQGDSDFELERINTYFQQHNGNKYVPRTIQTDLDPNTIQSIQATTFGQKLNPQNFIAGTHGTGNIGARGYTDGSQILEKVLDVVRKYAQKCDCLQGFQLTRAIGGGTGSGFGSFLTQRIVEQYPDIIIKNIPVMPSPKADTIVQPYNAILAIQQLIYYADICTFIDNQSLYHIYYRTLKLTTPNYDDLNHLAASAISGITCPFRFPGQLNSDLRKLSNNLIPFPQLKFLTIGFGPLTQQSCQKPESFTLTHLTKQLFRPYNMMCHADLAHGRCLAASFLFRGGISYQQANEHIGNFRNKNDPQYIEWIPPNFKSSICKVPRWNHKVGMDFIGNTTGIVQMFRRIHGQFQSIFKGKRLLHWFTNEGVQQNEFMEAEMSLKELMEEYQEQQKNHL